MDGKRFVVNLNGINMSEEKTKYICKKCGEVNPKMVYYSFPAQFDCPICGLHGESDEKIRVLSLREAIEKRPEFYKKIIADKCNNCKDKEKCQHDRLFTYNLPECEKFKENI